jgi:MoaA/NifB/PqqE/SkfB family radical SAM enzyme
MRRLPIGVLWNARRFLRDEKLVRVGRRYVVNSFLPPFPGRSFDTLARGIGALLQGRVVPVSSYIAVTNRCRYRCWHCSNARRGDAELSFENVHAVTGQLQDMGVSIIGLTGGEPLLRDDIEEIVAGIDDRSTTILFTSGDGLSGERAARLKDCGLFGVAVSIDHYDGAEHDRRRGRKGAFATALDAVRTARGLGFYTMIQLVASRDIFADGAIERYLMLAKRLKVHEIRLLEPMPAGKLLDTPDGCLITCGQRRMLAQLHRRTNLSDDQPKVCAFAQIEHGDMYGCGAGFQHMYIDGRGNVCPCDFVPVSFGNVQEEKIEIIWRRMRAAMGQPGRTCFLMRHAARLKSVFTGELPVSWREAAEHLPLEHSGRLPGYYEALGIPAETALHPAGPVHGGFLPAQAA